MGRVIFCDFDGVLCTMRSHMAYTDEDQLMQHLDPIACKLIYRLCKETGSELVISSTWRVHHDATSIRAILMNAGMPGVPLHDDWATPTKMSLYRRGEEIQHWLDAHPLVDKYCIIDDDSSVLEHQKPFFVQTQFNDGLSWENFKQVLRIFAREPT